VQVISVSESNGSVNSLNQGRIKVVWGPWLKLRKGLLSIYIWKPEWTNWSTSIIETNEAWAKKRIIN